MAYSPIPINHHIKREIKQRIKNPPQKNKSLAPFYGKREIKLEPYDNMNKLIRRSKVFSTNRNIHI